MIDTQDRFSTRDVFGTCNLLGINDFMGTDNMMCTDDFLGQCWLDGQWVTFLGNDDLMDTNHIMEKIWMGWQPLRKCFCLTRDLQPRYNAQFDQKPFDSAVSKKTAGRGLGRGWMKIKSRAATEINRWTNDCTRINNLWVRIHCLHNLSDNLPFANAKTLATTFERNRSDYVTI